MNHIIIKLKKCKWCGKEFIKKHNREEYCSTEHRKYARQEQLRINSRKFYHKYKDLMDEEIKWGLGSVFLSAHRNNNFVSESLAIKREKQKLNVE
ncbi:hypothetical protein KQY27_00245 [Methanobrevibacter sp. TMH8]|uniref:hypothetical protein n=1 Tax=Methanobrevibacter sp. TMH8 TaxID=2848611 RepID=UPI001CC90655|nr:hypothetical protein [Methanobrevibacter sp. TMH8]MBZ9569988.1 hypothetical protein [Methanobrevibacter sp. TMH8]